MPTAVQTVRGPVQLTDLGPTLMHEHVFVMAPEALANYGAVWGSPYWDEEERVADAIAKLTRLGEGGIATLVDPTVPGLGRDIARVQRINAEVELHIIVASGLYAFLEMPNFLAARTDAAITDLFVREITEGINDTGVRAAFLKCAVESHGVTGDVPRILSTIAGAAVRTGVPVMVHTNAAHRTGLPALEALTGACFYDFMVGNPFFADEKPDYLLICREVLPALRDAGVAPETIEQMMTANPQAFFKS